MNHDPQPSRPASCFSGPGGFNVVETEADQCIGAAVARRLEHCFIGCISQLRPPKVEQVNRVRMQGQRIEFIKAMTSILLRPSSQRRQAQPVSLAGGPPASLQFALHKIMC